MNSLDDIARLRNEYAHRNQRFAGSDLYSWFNPAHLFALHSRQRTILSTLRKNGFTNLSDLVILEMGCGAGGVLTEYLGFGASPEKICGVDLLFDRLQQAHQKLPASAFSNADGQSLPFPSGAFDLVLQSTALSSILDPLVRQKIASEMLRVLKPTGLLLSYDFWLNPTNPQTCGLPPAEIRRLFPHCTYQFHKITLAPPLARRLVPISWMAALFLENLKLFNTHYLVAIRPLPTHAA